MLIALPLNHVVLGVSEKTMLRTEERGDSKQIAIMPIKDLRSVLDL